MDDPMAAEQISPEKQMELQQYAAKATVELRTEIERLVTALTEIRDLARTGLPVPGYTPEMWAEYRLRRIAADADHTLAAAQMQPRLEGV